MQQNRSTSSYNQSKPCRDGYDCLLQYDNPTEHNATYSHPCPWSELCRDVNRNHEHARQYTHSTHHANPCKYSGEECNKITDPEHRRTYRHHGLPDFLMPCKYKDKCRDRSIEHLKKYGHPSNFYQNTQHAKHETASGASALGFNQQACRYGNECRDQSDPTHCNRYSHPTSTAPTQSRSTKNTSTLHTGSAGGDMQQACRYGDECRDQSDPTHCNRYSHPTATVPTQSRSTKKTSTLHTGSAGGDIQQACKYGDECRDQSDPTHCNRYSHPTSTAPTQSRSTKNTSTLHIGSSGNNMQQACKYGDECRDQSDPTHCNRYSHPTSTAPTQSRSTKNTSSLHTGSAGGDMQQACRYGDECRNQSDPTHCNRYSHPTATVPTQLRSRKTTSTIHTGGAGDDMQQAYRIGGALALEKLSHSDQIAIQNMPDDAIIIVPGCHDHIDRVLNSLNIKFITVEQHNVLNYPFRNNQTVYINCASHFPVEAAERLRQEVEKGLHIITTDWALTHVLQVAFSDFVRHNGRSTGDEVVGIQVADPNHPLVNGFLPASKHAQPQWWLEIYSHPIEIVNKSQVRVLIRSEMLGQRYESDAVLITFNCGKGNVIHMISHFYLQRSETRDDRHKMSAKQYALDSKASPATTNLVENQGQNLNYAQIQSTSTSAQFIYNQIATRLNPTN